MKKQYKIETKDKLCMLLSDTLLSYPLFYWCTILITTSWKLPKYAIYAVFNDYVTTL